MGRHSSAALQRDVYEPLPAHLGSVGDAGEHVFPGELRVLLQDLVYVYARSEQVEDQRNPDAMSSYAGFAEAAPWVYGYSAQQLFS